MALYKNKTTEGSILIYIPLLFLTFLLFRTFNTRAEFFQTGAFPTEQGIPKIPYYEPECKKHPRKGVSITQISALDQTRLNESRVWLDLDINDQPIICAQKINPNNSPDIYCSPAYLMEKGEIPEEFPTETIGWKSDRYTLLKRPDNIIVLLTNAHS